MGNLFGFVSFPFWAPFSLISRYSFQFVWREPLTPADAATAASTTSGDAPRRSLFIMHFTIERAARAVYHWGRSARTNLYFFLFFSCFFFLLTAPGPLNRGQRLRCLSVSARTNRWKRRARDCSHSVNPQKAAIIMMDHFAFIWSAAIRSGRGDYQIKIITK